MKISATHVLQIKHVSPNHTWQAQAAHDTSPNLNTQYDGHG